MLEQVRHDGLEDGRLEDGRFTIKQDAGLA